MFLEKLNDLVKTYDSNRCRAMDKAILYGLFDSPPPLAKHVVFEPLPADILQIMIGNYKLTFPEQLREIYTAINGANLFWTVRSLGEDKLRIPLNYLSIYGFPLTFDRTHIEPFNICIEDLSRPKATPKEWLKFGSFYRPKNLLNRFDLFLDVESGNVFAVEHKAKECCIIESWDSLDDCLCYIIDLLMENENQG